MIAGIISILIGIGIPVGAGIYFLIRKNGMFLSFLTGMGAFIVSQLLFRIPLLNFLGENSEAYRSLMLSGLVISYGIAGITAGLFEETGRLVGLSVFRKGRTSWEDAFAFGLGHGGAEAIWVMCQTNGVMSAMFNGLAAIYPEQMLAVGVERLFAMMFHIGMTFVVMEGIRKGRKFRFWFMAVLLHGILDFSLVLQNVRAVWIILSLSGVVSMGWVCRKKKIWNEGKRN